MPFSPRGHRNPLSGECGGHGRQGYWPSPPHSRQSRPRPSPRGRPPGAWPQRRRSGRDRPGAAADGCPHDLDRGRAACPQLDLPGRLVDEHPEAVRRPGTVAGGSAPAKGRAAGRTRGPRRSGRNRNGRSRRTSGRRRPCSPASPGPRRQRRPAPPAWPPGRRRGPEPRTRKCGRGTAVHREHLASARFGQGEHGGPGSASRPYHSTAAAVRVEREELAEVVEQACPVGVLGGNLSAGEGKGVRRTKAAHGERPARSEGRRCLLVRHRHREPHERSARAPSTAALKSTSPTSKQGTPSQCRARGRPPDGGVARAVPTGSPTTPTALVPS